MCEFDDWNRTNEDKFASSYYSRLHDMKASKSCYGEYSNVNCGKRVKRIARYLFNRKISLYDSNEARLGLYETTTIKFIYETLNYIQKQDDISPILFNISVNWIFQFGDNEYLVSLNSIYKILKKQTDACVQVKNPFRATKEQRFKERFDFIKLLPLMFWNPLFYEDFNKEPSYVNAILYDVTFLSKTDLTELIDNLQSKYDYEINGVQKVKPKYETKDDKRNPMYVMHGMGGYAFSI